VGEEDERMALRFERREKVARYLDPRAAFAEAAVACEIRRDPLTGRSGRVAHVLGFQVQPVAFDPLIEASRVGCPFCPARVFAVTPRFPEEVTPAGRIVRGETVLVPNLAPYDEHSAVAVMSHAHYVPMAEFTALLLQDAFEACRAYFRDVQRLPATTYGLVFWNYMPASGGTQIHPHLQLFATDTPGNALEEELAASARYLASEGRPYWQDLLEAEETLGERFVARRTHTAWLTSFVSQSLLADLLILFPGQRTLTTLPEAALAEFCGELRQVLRALAAQGIYSFNLGVFPGVPEREDCWLHMRLSPRVYMTPRLWGTDTSALQHLYQEHFMVQTPEAAAQALRAALPW
jgi:UDPglucose--hexose-1-phosphate uridylyltransferase